MEPVVAPILLERDAGGVHGSAGGRPSAASKSRVARLKNKRAEGRKKKKQGRRRLSTCRAVASRNTRRGGVGEKMMEREK